MLLNNFFSSSLLLILSALFIFSGDGIYILYIGLISVFLVGLSLNSGFKFLVTILFLYMFLGLLPISTYRGVISIDTYKAYATFFYVLVLSSFLFGNIFKNINFAAGKKNNRLQMNEAGLSLVNLFIIISWLATVLIYFKHGNILLNQELRFTISPFYALIAKSGLYMAFILLCTSGFGLFRSFEFNSKFLLLIMPTLLIGSRGNLVLLALAYMLFLFMSDDPGLKVKLTKKRIGVIAFAVLCMVNVVFYLRRDGSGSFISADEILLAYFFNDGWITYIVMPLHLAFRETIGITNGLIERNLFNYVLDYPLVFAELLTVLPGEQLSPGAALGQIIGVVGGGGLTPGLIGGIYLDYGLSGLILAGFLFGFLFSILALMAGKGDFWVLINVITIVQFIHFYHRGFLKVEYLMPYLIILIFSVYVSQGRRL